MAAEKITDGIWSVGILNPNLRVFDIVMTTDYGTTYNSYLVKGSEKTALILGLDYTDEVKALLQPRALPQKAT